MNTDVQEQERMNVPAQRESIYDSSAFLFCESSRDSVMFTDIGVGHLFTYFANSNATLPEILSQMHPEIMSN